jgi:hypothetical protein
MLLKSALAFLLLILSFYAGIKFESQQVGRQRTAQENRAIAGFADGPKTLHEFKDR